MLLTGISVYDLVLMAAAVVYGFVITTKKK
ncbi:hypothetical protein SAMN05444484_103238 [Flavobacterium chilense]|uniref:Uncharacterized protein n=1 Tax=Flavobacterium chilense TaxID=946677 RepID=A0A1M7F5P8_9FLAO|nr:hypothetical protein SAMN05444484_103238 [Flavobacterium chilense]